MKQRKQTCRWKRIAAFLLAVLLPLSLVACTKTDRQKGTQTIVSASPSSNGQTPVFSLESLPEIGGFAPDDAPMKSFFPDGPADTFVPREDYGKLVPYIADITYYRSVRTDDSRTDPETGEPYRLKLENTAEVTEPIWGLATEDGRAVTKGIFDSFRSYEYKDGRCVYCLYTKTGTRLDMNEDRQPDMILTDGEGRWSLKLGSGSYMNALLRFGVPLFYAQDPKEKTACVYDLDGRVVVDLSRYCVREDGYVSGPDIVYTDGKKFLIKHLANDAGEEERDTLSWIDRKGSIVSSFRADGCDIFYDGGHALVGQTDEYRRMLFSFSGERLTEEEYDYLEYSEVFEGFIGSLNASPTVEGVRYFDKNGKRIGGKNAWSQDDRYLLDECYDIRDQYGSTLLFLDDWERDIAADIWGGEISFPVGNDRVDILEWICPDSDPYYAERYIDGSKIARWLTGPDRQSFFYVHTAEGSSLLCSADGALVSEIETPMVKRYDDGEYCYLISMTAMDGKVFCVSENGDLIIYDGDGGGEIVRIEGFYPEIKGDMTPDSFSVTHFGASFFSAQPVEEALYDRIADHLYYYSDTLRCLGVFSNIYTVPGGGIAAVSDTQSWLFGPDGNVLMRFTLPDFY